jgi:hypothetical protein
MKKIQINPRRLLGFRIESAGTRRSGAKTGEKVGTKGHPIREQRALG